MYLGRWYLLCVLIYTFSRKELEAKPQESTLYGESTTISSPNITVTELTEEENLGNSNDTDIPNNSSESTKSTSLVDSKNNGTNPIIPPNGNTGSITATSIELTATPAKPIIATTSKYKSSTNVTSKNEGTSITTPDIIDPTAKADPQFMENIKIILIMNAIILLIITVIIICVIIYYVFLFDPKNYDKEICKEIDVQCCCENDRDMCNMSEC